MLRHHITKYRDDDEGVWYAVSWLQLDLFGWCWCFSRRRIPIGGGSRKGEPEVSASATCSPYGT